MALRRRALRDLGTIAGVAAILALIIGANFYMRLDSAREMAIAMRVALEEKHEKDGVALTKWDLLEETGGTIRSGAKFTERLLQERDKLIHIVGYMTPLDQFRKVDRFMLLPMPLYCYFCQAPPLRSVLLVQMKKGRTVEKIYNEPVLVHGTLVLNEGEGQPFFYTLDEAGWGRYDPDELTEKDIEEEHMQHSIEGTKELMGEKEEEELYAPDSAPVEETPEQ